MICIKKRIYRKKRFVVGSLDANTVDVFSKDADLYLKQTDGTVIVRKKGFLTYLASHIWDRKSYNISSIVQTANKILREDNESRKSLYQALFTRGIKRYGFGTKEFNFFLEKIKPLLPDQAHSTDRSPQVGGKALPVGADLPSAEEQVSKEISPTGSGPSQAVSEAGSETPLAVSKGAEWEPYISPQGSGSVSATVVPEIKEEHRIETDLSLPNPVVPEAGAKISPIFPKGARKNADISPQGVNVSARSSRPSISLEEQASSVPVIEGKRAIVPEKTEAVLPQVVLEAKPKISPAVLKEAKKEVSLSPKEAVAPVSSQRPSMKLDTKAPDLPFSEEMTRNSVNMCWCAGIKLPQEKEAHCLRFLEQLYAKSKSQNAVSPEEMKEYLRGISLLYKGKQLPEKIEQELSDLLFRFCLLERTYFYTEEVSETFRLLSQKMKDEMSLKLSFAPEKAVFSAHDPNRIALSQDIFLKKEDENWKIFQTPWVGDIPTKEVGISQIHEFLNEVVNGIPSQDFDGYLQKVNWVLLTLATRSSMIEFKRSKDTVEKDVKKLERMLPDILKKADSMSSTNPSRTFRRIYSFCRDAEFFEKIGSSVYFWERFDPQLRTRVPIGFKDEKVTISKLAGQFVFIRDQQLHRGVVPQSRPIELQDKKILKTEFMAPPRMPSEWRGEKSCFYDQAVFSQQEWEAGKEIARERKKEILQQFKSHTPPVEFFTVMNLIKTHDPALQRFLSRYPDKGLSLLQSYVYPYCLYELREKTEYDSPLAKFLSSAASAEEIAKLNPEDPVKALLEAVCLSQTVSTASHPIVIQKAQLPMLHKMIRCIVSGDPVFVSDEAGSGKTTLASCATSFTRANVPYVFHIAPFRQDEPGWVMLEASGKLPQKGKEAVHIACTPDEVKKIIEQSGEGATFLKEALFILDECDSDAYGLTGKITEQSKTLEDLLISTCGASRLVFMTATPNLKTLEATSRRYVQKKQLHPDKSSVFDPKIQEFDRTKKALVEAMDTEWQRQMDVKKASSGEYADFVVQTIMASTVQMGKSILIEAPRLTDTTSPVVITLKKELEKKSSAALLYRDGRGKLVAYEWSGQVWKESPLHEYEKTYKEKAIKPPVFCLYTQDSIGGDFGMFSRFPVVQEQYVLYPDKVYPSYAIYQHLRRLRRGSSKDCAYLPAHFILGKDFSRQATDKDALRTLAEAETKEHYTTVEIRRIGQKLSRIQKQKEKVYAKILEAKEKAVVTSYEKEFHGYMDFMVGKIGEMIDTYKSDSFEQLQKKVERVLKSKQGLPEALISISMNLLERSFLSLKPSELVSQKIKERFLEEKEAFLQGCALATEKWEREALVPSQEKRKFPEHLDIDTFVREANATQRTFLPQKVAKEKQDVYLDFFIDFVNMLEAFKGDDQEQFLNGIFKEVFLRPYGGVEGIYRTESTLKTAREIFKMFMKKQYQKKGSRLPPDFERFADEALSEWMGRPQESEPFLGSEDKGKHFFPDRMQKGLQFATYEKAKRMQRKKILEKEKAVFFRSYEIFLSKLVSCVVLSKEEFLHNEEIKKLEERDAYYTEEMRKLQREVHHVQ